MAENSPMRSVRNAFRGRWAGVATLLCLAAAAAGCQLRPPPKRGRAAAPADAAPAPVKTPRLAALVELPNGIRLDLRPLPAALGFEVPAIVGRWLATRVGSRDLAGAALSKPIRLLVADPNRFDHPIAALIHVRDAAALRNSLTSGKIVVRRDVALIGRPDLVRAFKRYAFDTIAGLPLPPRPRAILFRPLFDAYEPEIQRAGARIAALGGDGAGKLAGAALTAMAKQTERVELSLESHKRSIALSAAAYPRPGSALARFAAAQAASDFHLLSRLPAGATPALVAGGHLALGPVRAAVVAFMRRMMQSRFGAPAPPPVTAALAARLALFSGDFALAVRGLHQPSPPRFAAVVAVTDSAKAKKMTDELMTAMARAGRRAGGGTVAGVRRSHAYRADAHRYRGVTVGEETITYDLSHASAFRKKALAAYARAPVKFDAAGFGKLFVVANGGIRAFINAARGAGRAYAPGAGIRAQLAAARTRKDSVIATIDVPALLASAGKSPRMPRLLTVAVGFRGGALRLRVISASP